MKNTQIDPVDAILAHYKVLGPWEPLPNRGVGNRIYVTPGVVLRIAADHPESLEDARTESVAAPIARAAGIMTPRLIAYDDTRQLTDRPFSLWERVFGETLGLVESNSTSRRKTWYAVGEQLALLHSRVRECPDPSGYLDRPERELRLDNLLQKMVSREAEDQGLALEVERLLEELQPGVLSPAARCFLHGDIHDMNIMCSPDDTLLAILDWGDAGWGDPTLEFAGIPLEAVPDAMQGYCKVAPGLLGPDAEARIIWDKLDMALQKVIGEPFAGIPVAQFRRFLDD
jgi:aminoglycoside phosphotransferase (APT) family kinase protein